MKGFGILSVTLAVDMQKSMEICKELMVRVLAQENLLLPNTEAILKEYTCKVEWDVERNKFTFQLV